jgi:hypothetical protein
VIEDLLRLPGVTARARLLAREADDSREKVSNTITLNPTSGGGLVQISTRGASPDRAVTLANALATESIEVARRVISSGNQASLVLGDFEDGRADWGSGVTFNLTPRLSVTSKSPKYGHASLLATCPPVVGCGPAVRVEYPFEAGVGYTVSTWAKADRGRPLVSLVFGSNSRDVVTSDPVRLTGGWRRHALTWTPKTTTSSAEFGLQTRRRGRTSFQVDGALVSDPTQVPGGVVPQVPSEQDERRFLRQGRDATLVPAHATGTLKGSTGEWALGGGAGGLLIAGAGIGGGWLALRRRKQEPDENPGG